jgi:hypothetical protein
LQQQEQVFLRVKGIMETPRGSSLEVLTILRGEEQEVQQQVAPLVLAGVVQVLRHILVDLEQLKVVEVVVPVLVRME